MKKIMVITAAFIALMPGLCHGNKNISVPAPTENVFLSSELLAFADGKSIFTPYIGLMLQIDRDLTKIQEGEKTAAGSPKGVFLFQGVPQTLRQLHKIEAESECLWCQLQQPLPEDTPSEMVDIRTQQLYTINSIRAELKKVLGEAKRYFIAKVLPFTVHAQGVQKLMLSLIEEECSERSNPNSFLLTWGECPTGKEEELLEKGITSFQMFDNFITDLSRFLKDVVYSCPKSRAEFLRMVKQKIGTVETKNDEHPNKKQHR